MAKKKKHISPTDFIAFCNEVRLLSSNNLSKEDFVEKYQELLEKNSVSINKANAESDIRWRLMNSFWDAQKFLKDLAYAANHAHKYFEETGYFPIFGIQDLERNFEGLKAALIENKTLLNLVNKP